MNTDKDTDKHRCKESSEPSPAHSSPDSVASRGGTVQYKVAIEAELKTNHWFGRIEYEQDHQKEERI
jgi:hypothetical protein